MKISLNISWTVASGGDIQDAGPIAQLLGAIREKGSLTEGARAIGWSYRHAWGYIGKWESMLGVSLISRVQGQRAVLTHFGHMILYIDRCVTDRLGSSVNDMSRELNDEYGGVLDAVDARSSGKAVEGLPE